MAKTITETSDRQYAYREILITAIEGGINYWAKVEEYNAKVGHLEKGLAI